MAWVEYTGSFKDAITISKTDGMPFNTVRGPKDEYTWQDSGKLLKLHENTFSSSGALHLRVAEGWRVAFRIATENTDYFQDNIREEYVVKIKLFINLLDSPVEYYCRAGSFLFK